MKWYKQDSDCHQNLKVEAILGKWKMMGYGVLIVCREMVAREVAPDNLSFSISNKKNWLGHLRKTTSISEATLSKILADFAEVGLISKRALKRGALSIPKMRKRCDEYIDKLLKESGKNRDKIGSETEHKNRIDKIRTDKTAFLKPYYRDDPIIEKFGKRFVKQKNGEELLWAGEEKDITYK